MTDSARARLDAFERSDFEAMLNYYIGELSVRSANRRCDRVSEGEMSGAFHGLDDQALLPGALNGTWQWLESDLTLVTIPGAGHFVQQDASEVVSATCATGLGDAFGRSAATGTPLYRVDEHPGIEYPVGVQTALDCL